jgi:hypothetical protein
MKCITLLKKDEILRYLNCGERKCFIDVDWRMDLREPRYDDVGLIPLAR